MFSPVRGLRRFAAAIPNGMSRPAPLQMDRGRNKWNLALGSGLLVMIDAELVLPELAADANLADMGLPLH